MLTHAYLVIAANDPAATVPSAGPNAVGYGAIVVGLGFAAFAVGKWSHVNKDARKLFVVGVVVAVLLGSSTGIFGELSKALRQTGDSVGNSVTDNTQGR